MYCEQGETFLADVYNLFSELSVKIIFKSHRIQLTSYEKNTDW